MKSIVVTGAGRGVGEAIAAAFVARGWRVLGLGRDRARLADVATRLGERFAAHVVDVRDADAVTAAFATFGPIDVLVNNAAVFRMGPITEMSARDVDAMIDTNLKGTIFCTLAALPNLGAGGRIINIGSVAGTHGIRNQAIYCASKFGVDGFGEALNQELIARGVTLTTICPGGIDTPLWDPATNPYPGELAQVLRPDDVVGVVTHVVDLPPHVVMKKIVLFPTNEWH
jgi:NADP-dependent 3-hydroxy acid dehydrogenase YdfG